MKTTEIERLGRELNEGRSVSNAFFDIHNRALSLQIDAELERLRSSGEWASRLQQAQSDLESWASGGRKQNYDPESLTIARISKEFANRYEEANSAALLTANAMHQAVVTYAFLTNKVLFENLVREGKEGRKFGLVEMADRLGPALQPAGSSAYYHVKYVPYGIDARTNLGENRNGKSLVTSDTAIESASNLINKFGVYYALAETSAAPRSDVPKSGRKPELYVCTYVKGGEPKVESHQMNTLFRTEFDSRVREEMYQSLRRMLV